MHGHLIVNWEKMPLAIIHASGTSSAQGMLDCAPAFCTVMEAARFAYAIAASRSKSAPRDMDFQRATATV